MGKTHEVITDRIAAFIAEQHMFFVASAPLTASGHVNLSPKGLDTFRILDDTTVAYADYVGSGAETIAHLKENGRVVVMFCSFAGAPQILRLHGIGEVIEAADEHFDSLIAHFDKSLGVRAVIRIRCTRISTSCGFGVPLMTFEGHRSQLDAWCDRKGIDNLRGYQVDNNSTSIDGLRAIDVERLQ